MSELRTLLESLRQGQRPPISVNDLELLLAWLTGSAERDKPTGHDLPNPGHDPVLLQMVFFCLDDVLFDAGELRISAAGLDYSETHERRRNRFRRLASAFHPDRFPDLADWLTQRSQAVHRAYARFKQDPDAPVRPSPIRTHASVHAARAQQQAQRQDLGRAAPQVRKHRMHAFANRLRTTFGNDRYLAHKLIGGLALLALLPVFNMVLVPVIDPIDDDARIMGMAEKPVSVFTVPVSGEKPGGGAGDSGQMALVADSGEDEPAQDTPLSTRPPADQQTSESSIGVRAGLASNDGEPKSRIPAGSTESVSTNPSVLNPESENPNFPSLKTESEISPLLAAARRAMNPSGDTNTVPTVQSVDEQLAAMGLENDTERLYRRIAEEESVDRPRERQAVSKINGSSDGDGSQASLAAGAGSDRSARDAPPTEDDDLADGAGQDSVGAGLVREQSARDAPPTENEDLANGADQDPVGAGLARREQSARDVPPTIDEDQVAGASQDPVEAVLAREGSARDAPPTAEEELAEGVGQEPVGAGLARDESELVLGPLGQHPAGEVLQRFHGALAAGNISGIADVFAPDARMDNLRGRDEIAEHFRAALDPADSHQVRLKVLRLGRDEQGWLVEADLDIRVDSESTSPALVTGRSNFLLVKHNSGLTIDWMETE